MSEFNLIARLKARADAVETVKAAALAIVEQSRDEEGCISYDVHQSLEDPSVFVWYETWTDKAALDAHFATDYVKEFFAIVDASADEPPVITLANKLT